MLKSELERILALRTAFIDGASLVFRSSRKSYSPGIALIDAKTLDEHAADKYPMPVPNFVEEDDRRSGDDRRSAVNHPSHYHKDTGIEVIDAIEAWKLGFSSGNAVKYIARSGHKDPAKQLEDLQKALWYLNRAVANVEQGKAP